MTQDISRTAAVSAALGPVTVAYDPAARAAARHAAAEQAQADTMAAIREKGFTTYAADLEKEKLEKLREELLRAMGLTEEDLAEMDPQARGAIEQRISDEIQKRLAAASLVNAEGKGETRQATQTALRIVQGGGVPAGAPVGTHAPQATPGTGSPLGRDMVVTLQDVGEDGRVGSAVTDVKDSRARGRGLPG
ncbi:hypothetical protein [Roseospira visakhapatnamensis]|uniref:Uncharacterized protein n=1 Tax=Roseospira visakhapatnamensis TaxID=390880 RepID=A0A7W6W983_9PROT|nr:hypothetical protein [Roseospira visakhapatnamensis]MBB4265609.1 hypothetical protein [Roseospira visakhapatnamensis]